MWTIYQPASMVQLTPGGIGSPLGQYRAKFKTELKSWDLLNFNGGGEHAALGLVVLPVALYISVFNKPVLKKKLPVALVRLVTGAAAGRADACIAFTRRRVRCVHSARACRFNIESAFSVLLPSQMVH